MTRAFAFPLNFAMMQIIMLLLSESDCASLGLADFENLTVCSSVLL